MKSFCTIFAFALVFSLTSTALAAHKSKSTFQVKVIDEVPTTNTYNWSVSGSSVVNCYGNSCYGSWTPPDWGTAQAGGATVKLLLPDGRIVIAECDMKPDNFQNFMDALNSANGGAQVSTVYRDCRMPYPGTTICAKFKGGDVKLYMRVPSIDGRGKKYSETYSIITTLNPVDATGHAKSTQIVLPGVTVPQVTTKN